MTENQTTDKSATPINASARRLNEDWLAVGIGLLLFFISLLSLAGVDAFGWVIKTNVWVDAGKIMTPVSARFSRLPGLASLLLTFLFMTAILSCGAKLLGARVGKFVAGFTVIFFVSYLCWAA